MCRAAVFTASCLFASLSTPAVVRAGIPIVYGSGDAFTKLAELPAGHPAKAEMGPSTAVGYKYYRFHIYYAAFWTSSGEYCLYAETPNGIIYDSLGDDLKAAAEASGVPASELGKPFCYTVPLGWLIVGGGAVVLIVASAIARANSDEVKAAKLMKRPEYREAMERAAAQPDARRGFEAAVAHLVGRGIDPDRALGAVSLIFHAQKILFPVGPELAAPETVEGPVPRPSFDNDPEPPTELDPQLAWDDREDLDKTEE